MGDHIRYAVNGGVGTITIDRPDKRNAMTWAMLQEFNAAVAAAGDDEQARVLVITGVPGAFCAGTDLADLASTPESERSTRGARPGADRPAGDWWPIVHCPKPVIAAVDGPAVGMGVEFTVQCDVRIATTRARFGWNFVHRGLVPDTGAGTWLLPRLIGPSAALRLLYSGEIIDAAEALRLGYLTAVVEPDDLETAVAAEAARFLAGSPHATKLIKALVYGGLESDLHEHMGNHRQAMAACFHSDDHREGVAAFLERRPPEFTGR